MTIIVNKDFKAVAVKDSSEVYHENNQHVNNGSLKVILKSPASFRAYWLDEARTKQTPAKIFGNLAHTAILETELFLRTHVPMPDIGDKRTKEGKIKYSDFMGSLEPGQIAVSNDDYISLTGMAESISKHTEAFNLLRGAIKETSIYFADNQTGIGLRVRPDVLSKDTSVMLDFKTTVDCTRDAFAKSIHKYGYHFQAAMYAEGIEALYQKKPDYFVFLAIEKVAPWECALYVADKEMIEQGKRLFRKAVKTLDESMRTGVWGRYQETMENIYLPAYAEYQEE